MNSSAPSVMTLLAVRAIAAIILVAEGDAGLVEGEQPAVRDGDAVSVARQIGEHRFGAGEGWLGVDHPALLADRREVAQEGPPVGEWCEVAEEGEPAGVVECDQPGEEQAAEQLAEHAHRQEERRPRRYPALCRRARCRRPARSCAHADGASVADPQVWSTAVMPIRAPRCRGSAAIVSIVSDAAWNSRS